MSGFDSAILNQLNGKMGAFVVNTMMSVLVALMRPLATITEVLYRTNMGSRYFTRVSLLIGLVFILLAGAMDYQLGTEAPRFQWTSGRRVQVDWFDHEIRPYVALGPAVLVGLLFLVGGVGNLIRGTIRYMKGQRLHSYSMGEYRLGIGHVVNRLPISLDPFIFLFFLIAGLAIAYALRSGAMGLLLVVSALMSLIMRGHEKRVLANRMLDAMDQQIEQERFSEAVMGPRNKSFEGYRAPLPCYVSRKFREEFLKPAETPKPPEEKPADAKVEPALVGAAG